jgi:hypothetical protein
LSYLNAKNFESAFFPELPKKGWRLDAVKCI